MFNWKGLHRAFWLRALSRITALSASGKVTLLAVSGLALGFFLVAVLSFNAPLQTVSADNVTTSVTVLNTPPVWTVDAQESVESSTSTPTNAGSVLSWTGTGTDSNNDNYYLLICKTSGLPTANSGSAPTCNGGVSNQWAVSASTASASQATAATTTKETFPFNNESNAWYAWICDANASLAQCNSTFKQGTGTTASPFVINHPPVFTALSNNGPTTPGGSITWTTTAHDNDTIRGGDTVRIVVCKANDFTGTSCGAGGAWATSTLVSSDPATTTPIAVPTQDKTYNAFVFLFDQNFEAATSTFEGTNSSFVITNVAPTVSAASISLVDQDGSGSLVLVNPNASTSGYKVTFQVTDNNSCLNSSSGNEIASINTDVYRSSVTQAACQVSGDFNSNSCYPKSSPMTNFVCTQDGGSCSGSSDTTATFTCTYSLWYNADPTDSGTQHPSDNWLASVQASDDNFATSSLTESTTGNELISFLAFTVPETSIGFGGLQPGQQNDPLSTTTTLRAIGNVGLDQDLYGDTMCTTWSAPDSCDTNGIDPSNDIPIVNQKTATSSVAYASAFAYALTGSTTPTYVGIHVPKTTATSSPQSKNNFWAIKIPATITVAGAYTGQDTITAITASSTNW